MPYGEIDAPPTPPSHNFFTTVRDTLLATKPANNPEVTQWKTNPDTTFSLVNDQLEVSHKEENYEISLTLKGRILTIYRIQENEKTLLSKFYINPTDNKLIIKGSDPNSTPDPKIATRHLANTITTLTLPKDTLFKKAIATENELHQALVVNSML